MWFPASPNDAFLLSNAFVGAGFYLAADPSASSGQGLIIPTSNGDLLPLTWTPDPQTPTASNICRASVPYFCLEVYGTGNASVRLAAPTRANAQLWTREPLEDGTFRFINNLTGSGHYLDTFADTRQAFMAPPDKVGQHWTFVPSETINGRPAAMSSASSIVASLSTALGNRPQATDGTVAFAPVATGSNFVTGVMAPAPYKGSAAGTTTQIQSSAAASDRAQVSPNNEGLSATAAAGIAVGVSAPVLVLASFLAILFFRRRANRRARSRPSPGMHQLPRSYSNTSSPYPKRDPMSASSDASTSIWGGPSPASSRPGGSSRTLTRDTTKASRYVPILLAPHNTSRSGSTMPQMLDGRAITKPKEFHELPG